MNYIGELEYKKKIKILELKNTYIDNRDSVDGFNGMRYTVKKELVDFILS